MEVRQVVLEKGVPATGDLDELVAMAPQWVLVFASVPCLENGALVPALEAAFPRAHRVGCSTAGEISCDGVGDGSAVVTAIRFDNPAFRVAEAELEGMEDSATAGQRLAAQLAGAGLNHVLVFGQGVNINGSALIAGMRQALGPEVTVSGGLAGDDGAFRRTLTLSNSGVSDRRIVAVGFYGATLRLSHGSFGGWQPFGPARQVTRSAGNILFELDGEPALEVYKRYLGAYAKDLPASGLLFPFAMLGADHNATGLIRTILGVDEAAGSLVLAGDIEQGGYLRLMHASTDALVDGAQAAAEAARQVQASASDSLSLLVSCVGRKLVMGARVDEEVEAVGDVLGTRSTLCGFYSYGEISPFVDSTDCRLHNQTMTITSLVEL